MGVDVCAKSDPLGDARSALPMPRPQVPRASVSGDVDATLFDSLKDLRRRLASERGVPAYVVFSDATLLEMAALRPTTEHALLQVSGVGPTKLERYGAEFLGVLRS